MTNILCLPKCIFLNIIFYMDQKDYGNFKSSCKYFYQSFMYNLHILSLNLYNCSNSLKKYQNIKEITFIINANNYNTIFGELDFKFILDCVLNIHFINVLNVNILNVLNMIVIKNNKFKKIIMNNAELSDYEIREIFKLNNFEELYINDNNCVLSSHSFYYFDKSSTKLFSLYNTCLSKFMSHETSITKEKNICYYDDTHLRFKNVIFYK